MRVLRRQEGAWILAGDRSAWVPASDPALLQQAEATMLAAAAADTPDPYYHATIVASMDCNLTCGYCFQNVSTGSALGLAPRRLQSPSISTEVIDQIESCLAHRIHAGGFKGFDLLLFGGEPLIEYHRIIDLLVRLRHLGLRHAEATTNGTLLTARRVVDARDAGLASYQVSFDGAGPVHDRTRKNAAGRGSYRQILKNLRDCREVDGVHWEIRVNLTPESVGTCEELLDDLAVSLPNDRTTLYFSRVMDAGLYGSVLKEDGSLASRVVELYSYAIERGLRPHRPTDDRVCSDCGHRNGAKGCVINTDGKLYSCWESAGRPGMEVGTLREGYFASDVIADRWVTCGYQSDPALASAAYRDEVDGGLLDLMRDSELLGSPLSAPR